MAEPSLIQLPDHILVKILCLIPIDSANSICQHWTTLFDTYIGYKISIGDSHANHNLLEIQDNKCPTPIWHSSLISNVGVSSCHILNLGSSQLPTTFKHPQLLKSVTFINSITETNFVQLLNSTTNLVSLTIHISSFHNLECFKLTSPIHAQKPILLIALQHVKELRILDDGFTKPFYHADATLDITQILSNTIGFLLCLKFPILKSFELSIPFIHYYRGLIRDVIFIFCRKHSESLEEFHLEYTWTCGEQEKMKLEFDDYAVLIKANSSETSQISAENPMPVLNTTTIDLSSLKKKCFDENDTASKEIDAWKQILLLNLTRCKSLEFLSSTSTFNFPKAIILKNSATLTVLKFHLTMEANKLESIPNQLMILQAFDCLMLKDCVNLKELCLVHCMPLLEQEDQSTDDDDDDADNEEEDVKKVVILQPFFMNCQFLPNTLQLIELVDFTINSEQVQLLMELNPDLKEIHLVNIGSSGNTGMTLSILFCCLSKMVPLIDIQNGLNIENRTTGNEQNNGGLMAFNWLLKQRTVNINSFYAKLGPIAEAEKSSYEFGPY